MDYIFMRLVVNAAIQKDRKQMSHPVLGFYFLLPLLSPLTYNGMIEGLRVPFSICHFLISVISSHCFDLANTQLGARVTNAPFFLFFP